MIGLEKPLSFYRGEEDEVIRAVCDVGRELDVEVTVGRTNLRDVFPHLAWGPHYNGSGLAATGLSLDGIGKIRIPSSYSYNDLFPWGSHPLTDPLWSTEETEFLHDGSDIPRAEKVVQIAEHSIARRYMRVCTRNWGIENCGRCGKCVRTMVTLHLVDQLADVPAFPDALPQDYPKFLQVGSPGALAFAEENLKLARDVGRQDDVVRLLGKSVQAGRRRLAYEQLPLSHATRWYLYEKPRESARQIARQLLQRTKRR